MTARRIFSFLMMLGALVAPIVSAFGQAAPAIAALPDQERRTAYSISGTISEVIVIQFALVKGSNN
jgi:hypothetical protein